MKYNTLNQEQSQPTDQNKPQNTDADAAQSVPLRRLSTRLH